MQRAAGVRRRGLAAILVQSHARGWVVRKSTLQDLFAQREAQALAEILWAVRGPHRTPPHRTPPHRPRPTAFAAAPGARLWTSWLVRA